MTVTKLDPLPWFAFNIGEYVTDTMRLQTESHGAYLLLMLDYYARGEPCPDDDFILAAVAKLPEETWKRHRKVLAPFFDIRDGHWFHKRIEREMLEASAKHSAGIARSKAANAVRWGKEGDKSAGSTARRSQNTPVRPKRPPRIPSSIPQGEPKESSNDPHLHKHPLITEGGGAPPPEGNIGLEGVGTPISRDFLPNPQTSDRARAAGMSVQDIDAEVRKFIGRRLSEGAFSHDWQGSFAEWIEREIAHRKKLEAKAPPRVEVNARYEPSEAEWDRSIRIYAKDGSKWSPNLGPEPGHGGCRAPFALLEKYGWDAALKSFIAPERKKA